MWWKSWSKPKINPRDTSANRKQMSANHSMVRAAAGKLFNCINCEMRSLYDRVLEVCNGLKCVTVGWISCGRAPLAADGRCVKGAHPDFV